MTCPLTATRAFTHACRRSEGVLRQSIGFYRSSCYLGQIRSAAFGVLFARVLTVFKMEEGKWHRSRTNYLSGIASRPCVIPHRVVSVINFVLLYLMMNTCPLGAALVVYDDSTIENIETRLMDQEMSLATFTPTSIVEKTCWLYLLSGG